MGLCGERDGGMHVPSTEYRVPSAECGVRSAECGVRSAECGVRSVLARQGDEGLPRGAGCCGGGFGVAADAKERCLCFLWLPLFGARVISELLIGLRLSN